LRAADCSGQAFSPTAVEYEKVVPFKVRMLETAWSRFSAGARPDLRALAGRLRPVPSAEGQVRRRLLSRVAGRPRPAHPGCARSGAARGGTRDPARSVRSIPALSPGATSRATRT
jgi:hypothetical protein